MNEEAFMSEIRAVNAKIDALLRFVMATPKEQKPGLTVTDAAKRLGVHRNTIHRMIDRGELRKVRRRIPNEQLTPYLS